MSEKYHIKLFLLVLTICALPIIGKAQSFEWESEPEIGHNNVSFTKILETNIGDLIMVGDKNGNNRVYKFNGFGKLIWEVSPSIRGRFIEDIISFDSFKTFYMIGGGLPFPERTNLYNIDVDGHFTLEKIVYTFSYTTRNICNKLYNGKMVTAGYGFTPEPRVNPLLEFRSLNGDTLGKFEYKGDWYSKVRKIYLCNNDTEFLLFCSQNGYGLLTTIRIDTLGNIIKANFWGPGKNIYESKYLDMVEKNNFYYMLVWLTNSNGSYVYKFNALGDSVNLTHTKGLFNTLAPTPDNGLILAKNTLLKLDSNMQVEWEKPFKEGVEIQSISVSKTGGYFGSGRRYNKIDKTYRTYVFKTNLNGDIETQNSYPEFEIYPNPFKDKINLELPFGKKHFIIIYNLQGKKCMDFEFTGSTYLNIEQLSQGLYILNLQDETRTTITTKKMLKIE
jgi:hypothetical protein